MTQFRVPGSEFRVVSDGHRTRNPEPGTRNLDSNPLQSESSRSSALNFETGPGHSAAGPNWLMSRRITGLENEYGCLVDSHVQLQEVLPRIRDWLFENH